MCRLEKRLCPWKLLHATLKSLINSSLNNGKYCSSIAYLSLDCNEDVGINNKQPNDA